jgi:protein disulfide-isomerase
VNTRTALSIIALVLVATAFGIYQRGAQSRPSPLSPSRVIAEMLDEARANARTNHKFLMVAFGADWCSDCLELSQTLEEELLRDFLTKHFVVFNVDVGQFNRNIDIAKSLDVDINQGIPTAVFFPPGEAAPSKRLGTNQILAYLNDVLEHPQTTIH